MLRHTAHIQRAAGAISLSVSPATNEPLDQLHDEETQSYTPDRTLVPLILVPDAMDESGSDLSTGWQERAWYMIGATGTETQITSTTPGHALWPTGYPLGLKVSTNVTVAEACRKYIFQIKAKGVTKRCQVTLRTRNAAAPPPSLTLDCPKSQDWDPFTTDADSVTIHPTVKAYGRTCTVAWKKIEGGVRRAIDTTSAADLELTLDTATGALTVNRRLMGSRVSLVCELYVTESGTQRLYDEKPVTMKRRIPPRKERLESSSYFSGTESTLHAEIVVEKEGSGKIANPDAELRARWYNGSTVIGEGFTHDFPVKGSDGQIPMAAEVTDRGPWCHLTTGDGTPLTLPSGAYLLGR